MAEQTTQDKINSLTGHYIVCGAGRTGSHVIRELATGSTPFVVLETNHEKLTQCSNEIDQDILTIHGDATDEQLIEKAGIARAKGLFACLANDKDNLYLTLLVRQRAEKENPQLRIVSRAIAIDLISLIRDAGANSVISPNTIGGMRMVSEMIRPNTTRLLDQLMQQRSEFEVTEVTLAKKSKLNKKTLQTFNNEQTWNVKIIAIKNPGDKNYDYNPASDKVFTTDSKIALIGDRVDLKHAKSLLAP